MDESDNEDESLVILQQQTENNGTTSLISNAVNNLPENTTDTQRMTIPLLITSLVILTHKKTYFILELSINTH